MRLTPAFFLMLADEGSVAGCALECDPGQMDHQLVRLSQEALDRIAPISERGTLSIATNEVADVVSRTLSIIGVRVGISAADYLQRIDGTPEPSTRTVNGIWWLSHGDDTALIGGFIIDGLAMTIATEGEGESPLAEGADVLDRATRAIASQHEGAGIVETGLVKISGRPSEEKLARVVVTRDHRIRRPEDILDTGELVEFRAGTIGLAIVQVIGGNKALVIKHGI